MTSPDPTPTEIALCENIETLERCRALLREILESCYDSDGLPCDYEGNPYPSELRELRPRIQALAGVPVTWDSIPHP